MIEDKKMLAQSVEQVRKMKSALDTLYIELDKSNLASNSEEYYRISSLLYQISKYTSFLQEYIK